MGILIRFAITGLSLWLATQIYPAAFRLADAQTAVLAAVVLGLANAFIRPVVLVVTLPLNLVTLGLFTLVANTLMVYIVVWLLGIPHGGFLSMFVVSLLVTLISVVLSRVVTS
ncbi:MAG: phage holin family protein [Armatimonadota bacterium]|nr:phage holin family protein [Armatimonadota bacterium]